MSVVTQKTRTDRRSRLPTGIVPLAVTTLAIAAVWLLALPWIAEQPRMKAHLDWLDERGIDPSAMYYTELDAMDEILRRQPVIERDHHAWIQP